MHLPPSVFRLWVLLPGLCLLSTSSGRTSNGYFLCAPPAGFTYEGVACGIDDIFVITGGLMLYICSVGLTGVVNVGA
jgi:hypothetical protein